MIFASKPDCSAPCWNEITPGSSSEEELLAAVESAPSTEFAGFERTTTSSSPAETRWYSWTVKDADLKGSVLIRESHASLLISVLDSPDYYMATYFGGERPFVSLALFYVDRGVIVSSDLIWWNTLEHTECHFKIDDIMNVDFVYLAQHESPLKLTLTINGLAHLLGSAPTTWTTDDSLAIQRCPS
jgi:hypothetical protein